MGSEERDTWGSTYQVMDQVSQNLQRTHGYSESTAKQAVARAAAEAFVEGSVGTPGETAMVRELEQSFRQEEVMKIAAPEQVVQGREIGQTVRQMEPEQVRLLEPGGDGSSLRQGVTLAGLGQPGSGTSEFAPGTSGWQAEREERAERAAEAQTSRSARGAGDSGDGEPDVRSRVPGGGVANDAGEPVLRPVFNSALRDSIREDVREGGGVIDAHRPADTSLWNSRNVEDTQQEQGSARLGRRYGT
ncbi:hypothetical protein [Brevundimonas vesicularis]|uniref:hypothetical protein n=1 Tax=Brevundimonas vesicularis TaxID=41276 RepID=UPI0022ABE173|nr:hypothetical protein [Brevundimonas vesicularis]